MFIVTRDNEAGPPGEEQSWTSRLHSLRSVWAVILLFGLILGGIYGGVFTATEGAGIGAGGGFLFALARGTLRLRDLVEVLVETAQTTAVLFMILIGAFIFANFINLTTMPSDLLAFIQAMQLSPVFVVLLICAIYVLLGSAMEELSMIALTVPLFYPVIINAGYSGIWFGVVVVIVCQIGLTSPPVGINIFIVKNLVPNLSLREAFRGTWPFNVALVLLLVLIILVPEIVTFSTASMR